MIEAMIEADITIAEDAQQLEQMSNLNTSVIKNIYTIYAIYTKGLVYFAAFCSTTTVY